MSFEVGQNTAVYVAENVLGMLCNILDVFLCQKNLVCVVAVYLYCNFLSGGIVS